MPVCFKALLRVSLIDAALCLHFLKDFKVNLLLIDSHPKAFRQILLRFMDVEPSMLLDLLYSVSKVWVWH